MVIYGDIHSYCIKYHQVAQYLPFNSIRKLGGTDLDADSSLRDTRD